MSTATTAEADATPARATTLQEPRSTAPTAAAGSALAADVLAWTPASNADRRRRALLLPIVLMHGVLLWALVRAIPPATAVPAAVTFIQLLTDPVSSSPAMPQSVLPAPERRAPPPTWAPWPEVPSTPTPDLPAAVVADVQASSSAAVPVAAEPALAASSPAPVRAPAPERQVSISEVAYLAPPVLDYPLAARRRREEGVVHVRVRVDTDGRPGQSMVIRSSGHDALDSAALATVRATRFKPYTEDGVPRPFWVVMPLVFELES